MKVSQWWLFQRTGENQPNLGTSQLRQNFGAKAKVILTSHQLEENVTVHLRRFRMAEKLKSNRKNKTKYKIFLEIIVDASSLIVSISTIQRIYPKLSISQFTESVLSPRKYFSSAIEISTRYKIFSQGNNLLRD